MISMNGTWSRMSKDLILSDDLIVPERLLSTLFRRSSRKWTQWLLDDANLERDYMQCSFSPTGYSENDLFEDVDWVEQMSEMSEYYIGTLQRQLFPL